MPAVRLVDMCRIVDEVFEGEGERDDPKHMQGGGHPAQRRRQALGMAGHERVGGRWHGGGCAGWFGRRNQMAYVFLCISIYLGNREVYMYSTVLLKLEWMGCASTAFE